MANGSGARIGGNVDAPLRLDGTQLVEIGGSSIRQDIGDSEIRSDLGKDFTATLASQGAELRESLVSLSTSLAALKPTGEIKGGDTLVIEGGKGLNVYSLSLDAFRDAKDISVTAADGSTIVINVSGESGVLAANFLEGSQNLGKNVVWNFFDAKDLVFDSAFLGTVLAPGALVTTGDYLEGTLVAAGLEQGGALRMASFQGDLSTPESGGSSAVAVISATPEPSTWAMMILGFGLVGAAARRRSRRSLVLQAA